MSSSRNSYSKPAADKSNKLLKESLEKMLLGAPAPQEAAIKITPNYLATEFSESSKPLLTTSKIEEAFSIKKAFYPAITSDTSQGKKPNPGKRKANTQEANPELPISPFKDDPRKTDTNAASHVAKKLKPSLFATPTIPPRRKDSTTPDPTEIVKRP